MIIKTFEQWVCRRNDLEGARQILHGEPAALLDYCAVGDGKYELFTILNPAGREVGLAGLYEIDRANGTACVDAQVCSDEEKTQLTKALFWLMYHAFEHLGLEKVYLKRPDSLEENKKMGYWGYLGFVREGVLREQGKRGKKRYDVVYYGMLKRDFVRCQMTDRLLRDHFQLADETQAGV